MKEELTITVDNTNFDVKLEVKYNWFTRMLTSIMGVTAIFFPKATLLASKRYMNLEPNHKKIITAHEIMHMAQCNKYGTWKFLALYAFFPSYRLRFEVEAYTVTIMNIIFNIDMVEAGDTDYELTEERIDELVSNYASILSSGSYLYMASFSEAYEALFNLLVENLKAYQAE